MNSSKTPQRRGAIAVIIHERRFLVIERSATVRAPGKFCFPGGGIEVGESEEEALVRELEEELRLRVRPLRRLWQSETESGVALKWWQASISGDQTPVANPHEVADWAWLTTQEMEKEQRLLRTNREFLWALSAGEFQIDGIDSRL